MNRIVIIDKCEDCPFVEFEYPDLSGDCTCAKLKIKIYLKTIPEDCPLKAAMDEVTT